VRGRGHARRGAGEPAPRARGRGGRRGAPARLRRRPELVTFFRSAAKPLQALPLVDDGAFGALRPHAGGAGALLRVALRQRRAHPRGRAHPGEGGGERPRRWRAGRTRPSTRRPSGSWPRRGWSRAAAQQLLRQARGDDDAGARPRVGHGRLRAPRAPGAAARAGRGRALDADAGGGDRAWRWTAAASPASRSRCGRWRSPSPGLRGRGARGGARAVGRGRGDDGAPGDGGGEGRSARR
jgi:hypothetical protein